jgi:hypothetical protein
VTTTVGGDTTSLDAQSTTWFDTFCTGVSPLTDLQDGTTQIITVQDLSTALTNLGTAFQNTGNQLSALPPPTFEGADTVAQQLESGLISGGQTFLDYGRRALTIDPNDTAAQQQFVQDFQAAASQSAVSTFKPTDEVKQAVLQIPSCKTLFGSS